MISKQKFGILAALLLISAFAPQWVEAKAPPVAVRPAMWVIRDADSTVYLLGSIHVMKPDTTWLNPAIQSRFDSAEDVWFEIPDLDDKAAAATLAAKYMVDPAGRMSEGLTPQEITRVDDLLKPMGLSTLAAKNLRKWAVGLLITLQQVKMLGYTSESGVDVTLLAKARAGKKAVHGLETMDSQMQALVPESDADELTGLRATLVDVETMPKDLDDLFAAWEHGDTKMLSHLMIDKMRAEDLKSYQRLMVQRNAAWEPQIEAILAGKGTAFITVGAGHLVGPDSVIAMLKKQGIQAERLPD